jgi:uncharacterized membrane protein YphA (DoxX/SURF4 family)
MVRLLVEKIFRWVLSAAFLYAGTIKLLDPDSFAVLIRDYGLLPPPLVYPVALLLPAIEVIAAIGLFLNIKGSLTSIAFLVLFFIGILSYGIWMGLDVDCGCFGSESPENAAYQQLRVAIFRDVLMMLAVIYLYWFRWDSNKRNIYLKIY